MINIDNTTKDNNKGKPVARDSDEKEDRSEGDFEEE